MTSLPDAFADYNAGVRRARDAYNADIAFDGLVSRCVECGIGTVPLSTWKQHRDVCRVYGGHLPRMGRGLCRNCYARASRDGDLNDYSTRNVPTGVTAEEWRHLADPFRPLAEEIARLAPRFGRSPNSLRAALWRAGIRSHFIGGHGESLRPADQRRTA